MSSWLSNNLTDSLSSISNFTGQISSFTREMLTEGTEEVSGKIHHGSVHVILCVFVVLLVSTCLCGLKTKLIIIVKPLYDFFT